MTAIDIAHLSPKHLRTNVEFSTDEEWATLFASLCEEGLEKVLLGRPRTPAEAAALWVSDDLANDDHPPGMDTRTAFLRYYRHMLSR